MKSAPCTIGIDLGTTGVRAVVVDDGGRIIAKGQKALPTPERKDGVLQQDPELWWEAVDRVLLILGTQATMEDVDGICIDGTSGTILICDRDGVPLAPARMYNDQSAVALGQRIDEIAPGGFNPNTPNVSFGRVGDYSLSRCGGYWLSQAENLVSGNLTGGPRWEMEPKMSPVLLDLVASYVAGDLDKDALVEAGRVDPALQELMINTRLFIRSQEE